jgi:tetratricopeptide (TPR) repeat protein
MIEDAHPLVIEAQSVALAKKDARARTPAGHRILSVRVLSDGDTKTERGSGETAEIALEKARSKLPSGAQVLTEKEVVAARIEFVEVEAASADEATSLLLRSIDTDAVIESVELMIPARSGFLGLGRKRARFRGRVFRHAVVEVVFKVMAKIRAEVGPVASLLGGVQEESPVLSSEQKKIGPHVVVLSDDEKSLMQTHGLDPLDPKGFVQRARQFHDIGSHDRAFQVLQLATKLLPQDPALWMLCGMELLYMDSSEWERQRLGVSEGSCAHCYEAIPYLDRSLQLNPHSDLAWYNKAQCLCHIACITGDADMLDRGLSCYDEALRIKPGDAVYVREKHLFGLERTRIV